MGHDILAASTGQKPSNPMKIIWAKVFALSILHMAAIYGTYLYCTQATWKTISFAWFYGAVSGLGITAGAHRLWAHKTYKAKLPLRVFLAFMNAAAYQKDIYYWCRDHRLHHKYSETNADPHNAKRGFFFSHIGWLMVKRQPDVIERGNAIDLSDLLADPVVVLQRKYYVPLVIFFCFGLPTAVPMMLWGESLNTSFFVSAMMRYALSLNFTCLVNSAAHMWGNRPYDQSINPSENMWVVFGALGEGFHNYHHTFPGDYATSEYGLRWNLTTAFIDAMAVLGLAYDRKTISREMIQDRKKRTGEGSSNQNKTEAK